MRKTHEIGQHMHECCLDHILAQMGIIGVLEVEQNRVDQVAGIPDVCWGRVR